jgi:hypothetical protein
VGRGRGWGVSQQETLLQHMPRGPPPPTPPRHAQGRVEGGEKSPGYFFNSWKAPFQSGGGGVSW